MKKLTLFEKLLLITIPSYIFSSPTIYDLGLYGQQNWASSNIYNEYPNSNFWSHHYWNFDGTDHGAGSNQCNITNCTNNHHTHSGIDYRVDTQNNNVLSYGFGKIISLGRVISNNPRRISYGQVSLRNLVNSGDYFQVNLLHSANINRNILSNNYIVKRQYIGIKSGIGSNGRDIYNHHLHFEVADSVNLSAPRTAHTYPCSKNLDACRDSNNALRVSQHSKGGLTAHYDDRDDSVRYYNPLEFASRKQELLPTFSRTQNRPTYTNFDVYGIANKTIYGYLNINATDIDRVGILVKNTNSRTNADNDTNNIYIAQKFLAQSSTDFHDLYGDSDRFSKGDYLFIPYIEDGNEKRYGYPVKFSFVSEGGFIVDNDKSNDRTAQYSEHFRDNTERNIVPGYSLTARLAKATEASRTINNYAQWKVPDGTRGTYKVYAHIPKGATATQVHYTIHTKNGDIQAANLNQTLYKENWLELGEYELDSDSYVKLSLYGTEENSWVAFDAIKFEKKHIDYPDTKNLDTEYQKAIDYLSNTLPIFHGYTEGPKKGQFGAGDNITRAELSKVIASMLTHIMKESEITQVSEKHIKENYTDWDEPDWFMKYARIVVGMNIMTGYFDEKKLKPDNNVTYRELSKIVTQSFFYGKIWKKKWLVGTVLKKYLCHQSYYECLSNDDQGYIYTDDSKTTHDISSVFQQPGKTKIPGNSYDEGALKATREDVALFLYRAYMLWKNKVETTSCVVDEENEKEGWGL